MMLVFQFVPKVFYGVKLLYIFGALLVYTTHIRLGYLHFKFTSKTKFGFVR